MDTLLETREEVGEWVKSARILIPELDIKGSKSFVFATYFALGDHRTSNLAERLGDFDQAFYGNARRKCLDMPQAVRWIDLPAHHVRSFAVMTDEVPGQKLRIPIKAVGWLKQQQILGNPGNLLVNGNPNLFVCRASIDNTLRFVSLHYGKKGWVISSERYHERYMITGPCRIFVACRD